jgi:hypothetical protein
MPGLTPVRSAEVVSALDELERLGPSDSALALAERLLQMTMTAEANIRFEAVLSRLVQETDDHRYHRAWTLHAINNLAFGPALSRATAGLERLNGSAEASEQRLVAARAALQLSRMAEARQHVRAFAAADYPATETLFRLAINVGLPDLACDVATQVPADDQPISPLELERAQTGVLNQREGSLCRRVKLISLGPDCLPWLMFNRWGMRADLDENWWPMPFNLAGWNVTGIVAALEDRFDGLPNAETYRIVTSPRGLRMPRQQTYGVIFGHEGFLPGQADESELLESVIEEYSARANNFLDQGCRGPRLYLYHAERAVDLERLRRALDSLAHDDRWMLLVIDECEDPEWQRRRPASTDRMIIRPVDPPQPREQWYRRRSDADMRFQRELVEVILETMRNVP